MKLELPHDVITVVAVDNADIVLHEPARSILAFPMLIQFVLELDVVDGILPSASLGLGNTQGLQVILDLFDNKLELILLKLMHSGHALGGRQRALRSMLGDQLVQAGDIPD